MTRPDLDAIEARALAAGEGWEIGKPDAAGDVYVFGLQQGYDHEMSQADAALIVNARPDLLALVARVRELEAEIRETIGAHDDGRCTVARLRNVMRDER